MSEPLQASADDQELLAELEALSMDLDSAPLPAKHAAYEPPPGVSIARAYASRVQAAASAALH
jgi:hypothetical protein